MKIEDEEIKLYNFIKTFRKDYTRDKFQEACKRTMVEEPGVLTFTSRTFKNSVCNNHILNIFLRSLFDCLQGLEKEKISDGYTFLKKMGECLLNTYMPGREIKAGGSLFKDEIVSLANLWVREGLAKKVIIIAQEGNNFKFQIYSPFGSQIFAEIFKAHGTKYVRPCPLNATLIARCSEFGYKPEYLNLNFDNKKDVWDMTVKLVPIRRSAHARAREI